MKIYYSSRIILIILISFVIGTGHSGAEGIAPKTSVTDIGIQESPDKKMAWWREAKFGMFIHWGLYAVPGNSSEWHMRTLKKSVAEYSKYAAEFNPVKFNANDWAQMAYEAGMKYMVITTKHHDGFALFKSEASSYNMMDATPFKRDVIRELADACPKNGIRLGLYYSLMADWGHPGGGIGNMAPWDPAQKGDLETYFNMVAYPQVKEILSNYGPVAELWFDTDGSPKPDNGQTARIQNLIGQQPNMIVNNRVIPGDFANAERHIPAQAIQGDWEACEIIISGSWGYYHYKPQAVRPLSSLIRQLIDVVSKGGNMLLNVGPKPDGTFPDDAIVRLKGIGNWMKVNGEAIYGTTASPFDYLPWGRCTRKGDKLYLHVFNWPTDGKIKVPVSNKVLSASILADKTKTPLKVKASKEEITVSLPPVAPDSIASMVVLQIKGEPNPVHSLALDKKTDASASKEQSKHAVDSNPGTAWEIPEAFPCWLTIDLQSKMTFNTVRIGLGMGKVTKFSVEYWKEGQWVPIFKGENLPLDEYVRNFRKITAQRIRFSILEVGSPQRIRLNSFELFDAH